MSIRKVTPRLAVIKGCYFHAALLLALVTSLAPRASASEAPTVALTAKQWNIHGDVAFDSDEAQRNILVVTKGYAELKHTHFSNGTIEFDTKFVGARITGITFRHHGESADALYFRPSKDCPTSDDCMQYMPTAYGVFEWDLYGESQTRAPINPTGWNHIKLVVSGGQMNVFVNGARTPTLAVAALVGGSSSGAIRLHGPASYANLRVAPNRIEGWMPASASNAANMDRRFVRHWLASVPFAMPSRPDTALQENTGIDPAYASVPTRSALWKPVTPDDGGLINLTRAFGFAQTGKSIAGIWLKTTMVSNVDQVKHVDIGWTREVWVYVNGRLVFANKNLYGVKGASKEPDGRLSLTNGSFDLPLRKGTNHIVVAIDDNFGGGEQHFGWGLLMRLADVRGVRVN